MRKIEKIKKFVLSSAILMLGGALIAGCETSTTEKENVLTFEVAETLTLPYGEYYMLPSVIGKDTNGNLYFPKLKVTDSEGKEVIVERGKFYVVSEMDYTFEYTITFGGETFVKTTTAKVADLTAPQLSLATESIGGFINERIEIPVASYKDNVTATEELVLETKVFLDSEEISIADGGFTPTECGEYTIQYSVKDLGGNVTEKSVSATVIEKEEGNIAYFNSEWWKALADTSFSSEESIEFTRGTGKYASPMGGTSLGASINNSVFIWGGLLSIAKPVIKDISDYQYFYIWVYTTREGGVRLTYNNYWYGAITHIYEGQWTRVVFEKGPDGNYYTNGNDRNEVGSVNKVFCIDDPNDSYALRDVVPTDISNFQIGFQALQDDQSGMVQMYFGGMYACNELPELPAGTKDWSPVPVLNITGINDYCIQNSTVEVGYTLTHANGATVRTYLETDGVRQLLPDARYTFNDAGEYTIVVEAELDGEIVASKSKKITVIAGEEGNIAYWNYENWAQIGGSKVNGYSSNVSGLTFVSGTGEYASPAGGTSLGIYAEHWVYIWGPELMVTTPVIQDVSSYNYLYVWVYVTDPNNVRLMFNDTCTMLVEAGAWTRIVFEKAQDGNFYLRGTDMPVFTTAKPNITPTNLKDFGIRMQRADFSYSGTNTDGAIQTTYFGGFYACNELPELSAGTQDWTAPAYVKIAGVSASAFIGNTVEIDYETNAQGATVNRYVTFGGNKTLVTGNSYTFANSGTYTFTVELVVGGNVVATDSKDVVVDSQVNISFWNNADCFNITGTNVNGYNNINQYGLIFSHGTGTYASPMGGTSLGVYAEHWAHGWGPLLAMNTPAVKDISSFKYLYVWVYVTEANGVTLTFNHGTCAFNVEQGQWTRIIFEKQADGNFYANGTALFNANIPATDMSKFVIRIQKNGTAYPTDAGVVTTTYFGGLFACNELPELPAGALDLTGTPSGSNPDPTPGEPEPNPDPTPGEPEPNPDPTPGEPEPNPDPTPGEPEPDPTPDGTTAIKVTGDAIAWRKDEWGE